MPLLRLRTVCKKIIRDGNSNKFTLILNSCDEDDTKKLYERELYTIDQHVRDILTETPIKSFINNQQLVYHEYVKYVNSESSKQILTLNVRINELTVKSNVKFCNLMDLINNDGKLNVILYVSVTKNVCYGPTFSLTRCGIYTILDVSGIEIREISEKKSSDKTQKIIDLIKKTRYSSNNMF
jgi:hypothetical protein